MKIYLATGNIHKKREMSQLFPSEEIVIPADEGIVFDPEETGKTFYENSMIKALALWNIVHAPVIADDSGICVDALGGIPGIFSARYAGPNYPNGYADGHKISQSEQNKFIIEQTSRAISKGICGVEAFPNGPRSCRYVCSMILMISPQRFYIAQETMEGCLVSSIEEATGTGGFGYDPLFFLPQFGKTAAELSSDQKNAISHRGKAAKAIHAIITAMKEN